jgi:5-methylcytosine-specific restriction endonuclease McrA
MISANDRVVRMVYTRTQTSVIRSHAKWNLTLEEFWEVWRPHWEGREKRQLKLMQRDERLPYQIGNVYIGSLRARNAAYSKLSRERLRGRACECCFGIDFQEIYQRAEMQGAHVDHIVALALGGKHCAKNLQILSIEQHLIKTAADMRAIALARRGRGIGNRRLLKPY